MLELLAPAGNLARLKTAFLYGADAVYCGGKEFSLRSAADNFTREEMREGIRFAHKKGGRVYVAVNITPHNKDLDEISKYAKFLEEAGADAVIVSDPGAFSVVRKAAPSLQIHVSTQANTLNYETARFWHEMGAKRIVLARELTLEEIAKIREKLPPECELEVFVHGAMCISHSGRCLLSNYLAYRDANRGECAQPCRWKYYLMEEKRPGEYMPVFENDSGTFIFNSKDLCMIKHIDKLDRAGVKGLKIEGRVKSDYYVATVVKAYREAIDDYYAGKPFDQRLLDEVSKVSHREYSEGFYFGNPGQIYLYSSYVRNYDIVGVVLEYDEKEGLVKVEQRNRFYRGDTLEFLPPRGRYFENKVNFLKNADFEDIDVAPHPQMILYLKLDRPVEKDTIIRKNINQTGEQA